MMKLRNLALICGVLVTVGTASAAVDQTAKAQVQVPQAVVVAGASVGERVNINSADAAALQKIKGFGKKKSEAVIDYRSKNGPFKSVDDLLKVKCRGLTKKWLDKISKFLTV